jgi:hypothetical protein
VVGGIIVGLPPGLALAGKGTILFAAPGIAPVGSLGIDVIGAAVGGGSKVTGIYGIA